MAHARILITGGSGFVGRHLLRTLGAAATALEVDVTEAGAVADAIGSADPALVIHLAAIAAPVEAGRDPDLAWRVNLHGTLNVARAVAASGGSLLFVSSGDAYGGSFAPGLPVDEAQKLAPRNTYAATKAAADLALGAMAEEGLRVVRMRPLNHCGPGQSDAFVVAAFARQVARIEAGLQAPVLEVGALDPVRDFLDVRDVCAAYAAAAAADLPPGTVLNVASGVGRRIGDILADLLRIAGVEAEIRTDPGRLRRSDVPVALGDAGRARATLGWAPLIPWEQTLRDVLDDWRATVRAAG